MVLRGKLRTSVRLITEGDTGVVLKLAWHYKKMGDRVMELLRTRHPNTCPLSAAIIYIYPGRHLELVPM